MWYVATSNTIFVAFPKDADIKYSEHNSTQC